MLKRHIALVNDTTAVSRRDLVAVAAAIQKQVDEDFAPAWGIHAKVEACATTDDVPVGFWSVVIKDKLDRPEAAGYHEDDLGEPCAFVLLTNDWSVTASHEVLEILADPWGRHTVAGPSPLHPGKHVKFLVEVCDPCSDSHYSKAGVQVSDFYLPHYFDPTMAHAAPYSHARKITKPLEVIQGGYLTWLDPEHKQWWHRTWFDGPCHADAKIAVPNLVKGGNVRAAIDHHVRTSR